LNRKYGSGSSNQTGATEGEVEDKGRARYDAGITVESVLPDDREMDKPETVRHGLENRKPIKGRTDAVFIPGKGVIPRNELGRSPEQ
jgi:hypothetical protein